MGAPCWNWIPPQAAGRPRLSGAESLQNWDSWHHGPARGRSRGYPGEPVDLGPVPAYYPEYLPAPGVPGYPGTRVPGYPGSECIGF
eukprot:2496791-Rhodomonas_salina.1